MNIHQQIKQAGEVLIYKLEQTAIQEEKTLLELHAKIFGHCGQVLTNTVRQKL